MRFQDWKFFGLTISSYEFKRVKSKDYLYSGNKIYVHERWLKTGLDDSFLSAEQLSVGTELSKMAKPGEFHCAFVQELNMRVSYSKDYFNAELMKEVTL